MQSLLVESAVRSTLLIGAVAVVLWGLRIRTASVRHAAWASVVAGMLVLPALVAWGPRAELRWLPVEEVGVGAATVASGASGDEGVAGETWGEVAGKFSGGDWGWSESLMAVYLVGFGGLLLRLGIGAARAGRLVRGATLSEGRWTHASVATPITVGWWRPLVILPVSWASWPEEQLNAVLAHEAEHVRRRDPFFQRLALLNRAIFWFHPLAWWLERELSGLAEEACDDAVLSQGHDAGDYSTCLIQMARDVEARGARVLGMAMPGTGLPVRIRRMLAGVPRTRVSRVRVAGAAVLCVTLWGMFGAGTLVRAERPRMPVKVEEPKPVLLAQAQPAPQAVAQAVKPAPVAAALEFEAAAIKPSNPDSRLIRTAISGGRFTAENVTLRRLIEDAYQLKPFQLSGGPGWMDSQKFSVNATGDELATPSEVRLMLRALLAERFQLTMRSESREQSTYALLVKDRDKLKLTPGQAGEQPVYRTSFDGRGAASNHVTLVNQSMASLSELLSRQLQRMVADETGLSGGFDFEFDATREEGEPNPFIVPWAPALGDIGLKLESRKGPVEVFVVDRAEKPSEN